MKSPRLPKFRMPDLRRPLRAMSDLVELGGLGCLVGAAWMWQTLAGLVALGLCLILIGWVMDR